MVEGLYDGAVEMAKIIGTWWMAVPPPNLESVGLSLLQQDLSWFVWVFAVIGFFLGLIRLVMTEDVRSGAVQLAKPIVNLVLATSVYMAAVPILLTAGDETARWLLDRSTEANSSLDSPNLSAAMEVLIPSTVALNGNLGVAFVVYLLMLLGAIVNFMFMIFRNLMLVILMAFIAVLAAASGTEAGNQAWRKANGWLVALLLFKPVAAGIYALGFRLMVDDTDFSQNSDLGAGLVSALTGLLILVLAAFALPGLIKFVVPAAAAGAGGFSGGAALAGAAGVAAGASVLAGGMSAGALAGGAGRGGMGTAVAAASTGSGGAGGGRPAGGGGGAAPGGSPSGGSTAPGASATAGGSDSAGSASGAAPAAGTDSVGGAGTGAFGAAEASGSSSAAAPTGASGADSTASTTSSSSNSSGPGGSSAAAGSTAGGAAARGAAPGTAGRPSGSAGTGQPASGSAGGAPVAPAQGGGAAEGRGRWAAAVNRVNQAAQAGQGASQAAQRARVDRVLDDEGEQ
ncbi:hypothetical protein E7744_14930 (plasmid) [Citricoccus sp. SGAir0253]|uniref:hypothetical protein n=1 Tax=Citricoccus sp. SGAir0253 TaxID=2567881 RepID=UPI0010CCD96B|nr:hypothetical protein [Citricoccus sp. SGAir0253]QCU79611.1 hypothetical protein E7744_14930 [Citricoccus sp. SGAir0253]